MAPESLADAIGAPYRIHSLKSRQFGWRRFRRRLQFEGRFLTPSTALVEVEDGRRFKLLSTSHNNRHWINHHLYNYEAASRLDFVPRLIWHDDQHILVEFIEGKTPAIEDDSFAVALGRRLAKVHQVDAGERPAAAVLRNVVIDLGMIVDAGFLAEPTSHRLCDRLSTILPANVRTSLTYIDLQPANFCVTESGALILFDLGSFQRGRITDDSLFGHKLVRPTLAHSLNKNLLKEAYLDAGGLPQLFDWATHLEVLDDVRKAALCVRRYQAAVVIQRGRRRMYRQLVADRVMRLQSFAEG